MTINRKDAIAGGFFVLVGGYVLIQSLLILRLGTASEMGPGYFPAIVGGLLFGLGIFIVFGSFDKPSEAIGLIPVRAILALGISLAAFGLLVRPMGLVATVAIVALISGMASKTMRPLFLTIVVVTLTALCVVVFHYGMELRIPLFGPVLKFWR
ncbi:tripartite tricarboxylate transporter TctB family protein [Aminobacter sp. MSH1]|uniref:tripartite tricarboxylate transporter TctB family protein n=1 Tax=Aminobacter sp. MSH1 TaxID=374606 RepID=UPI000D3D38D1|nr:tripartite tricarboxylate transporter TctB family protein [Aminobacter sp. MSH1]